MTSLNWIVNAEYFPFVEWFDLVQTKWIYVAIFFVCGWMSSLVHRIVLKKYALLLCMFYFERWLSMRCIPHPIKLPFFLLRSEGLFCRLQTMTRMIQLLEFDYLSTGRCFQFILSSGIIFSASFQCRANSIKAHGCRLTSIFAPIIQSFTTSVKYLTLQFCCPQHINARNALPKGLCEENLRNVWMSFEAVKDQ